MKRNLFLALIYWGWHFGALGAEVNLVQVVNEASFKGNVVQDFVVRQMVSEGFYQLTGETNLGKALSRWIKSSDVVGLKISTAGGKILATKPVLVDVLIEGLKATGVKGENIVVWDKFADEMRAAGYSLGRRRDGVVFTAVIPLTGFDSNVFVMQPEVGELIWGDFEFQDIKQSSIAHNPALQKKNLDEGLNFELASALPKQESFRSYVAKLVTRRLTKIIHMPVLSNSEAVGLQGCFADLVLGSVDNTRRFQFEPFWGDPALAEIYAKTPLRTKTVLHVMDGLWCQYGGGPDYVPHYCRKMNSLFMSEDPVALDSYALNLIEPWRIASLLPLLKINYIKTAKTLGLGNFFDNEKIEIKKIAMPKPVAE
ncbi:MAG: DUF362 domain-containing protein [Verrucomicrobiae bacterium]|nr:DUF362 domain-containing protein [Verrucomicrobiae bacterium]